MKRRLPVASSWFSAFSLQPSAFSHSQEHIDCTRTAMTRLGRSEGLNLRRSAKQRFDERLEDRAFASRVMALAVHDAHAGETTAHGGGEKVVQCALGACDGEAVQIELGLRAQTAAAQLAQSSARQAAAGVKEGFARVGGSRTRRRFTSRTESRNSAASSSDGRFKHFSVSGLSVY
jgi:hypothetical protein